MTVTRWPARRAGCLLLGACLVLAGLAGCNTPSDMPKTYPVTGTVVSKDGKSLSGASILFTPLKDPTFTVSGDIGADGSFSLFTVKGSSKTGGAPEGEYKVTIQPPIAADQRPVSAINLPKTYRIEAKSNELRIEIEASRRP